MSSSRAEADTASPQKYPDPFQFEPVSRCGKVCFWIKMFWVLFVKSFLCMLCCWVRHINKPRKAYQRFTDHYFYKYFKIQHIQIGPAANDIDEFHGIVMTTHKSYVDFTNGPAFGYCSALGRLGVAFLVPAASVFTCCTKSFLIFRRGRSRDFARFGRKIRRFVDTRAPRLMIYPEGTRCRDGRGLNRLRTGVFRIAFDQRIPVFLAPAEGAQFVLSEFEGRVCKGMPLVVNYLGAVDPKDFGTWEAFFEHCRSRFVQGYDDACAEYDRLVGHTALRVAIDPATPSPRRSEASTPAPVPSAVRAEPLAAGASGETS